MIKQILTQLKNKTITVKLKDDGTFSGIGQIELQDLTIEYFLEVATIYSTTIYEGDPESYDIEIIDIIVFDSDGDEVEVDTDAISKLIDNNIEFE